MESTETVIRGDAEENPSASPADSDTIPSLFSSPEIKISSSARSLRSCSRNSSALFGVSPIVSPDGLPKYMIRICLSRTIMRCLHVYKQPKLTELYRLYMIC